MLKVVGIRFKKAGKIYYFDPVDTGVEVGDHVIVETVRGLEYGTVVIGARDVEENKLVSQLKPVMRKIKCAKKKPLTSACAKLPSTGSPCG